MLEIFSDFQVLEDGNFGQMKEDKMGIEMKSIEERSNNGVPYRAGTYAI